MVSLPPITIAWVLGRSRGWRMARRSNTVKVHCTVVRQGFMLRGVVGGWIYCMTSLNSLIIIRRIEVQYRTVHYRHQFNPDFILILARRVKMKLLFKTVHPGLTEGWQEPIQYAFDRSSHAHIQYRRVGLVFTLYISIKYSPITRLASVPRITTHVTP